MAYPEWLIGPGITTISVTPLVKSAGAMVPGTAVSFFTTVDEIEWGAGVRTEDIRPLTQFHESQEPVSRGAGFRIREILRLVSGPAGESGNSLAELFHAYRYFSVVFTRAGRTWTGVHSNGGYTETIPSTKTTGVAQFMPYAEEAAPGNDFDTGRNLTATGAGI